MENRSSHTTRPPARSTTQKAPSSSTVACEEHLTSFKAQVEEWLAAWGGVKRWRALACTLQCVEEGLTGADIESHAASGERILNRLQTELFFEKQPEAKDMFVCWFEGSLLVHALVDGICRLRLEYLDCDI